MLSPEVWQFKCPRNDANVESDVKSEDIVDKIRNNNLYHNLTVVCPDIFTLPESITNLLEVDTEYYRLKNCPVTTFINTSFISHFVKKGSLTCLSVNKRADVNNCVAVIDQVLLLSVHEHVYQELGIESNSKQKGSNFYQLEINLSDERIRNDTKYHKRLIQGLTKLENFDFIIQWKSQEEDICPSSIAKYFSDKGIVVALCKQRINKYTQSVPDIPILTNNNIHDMVEWLGMVALGCDLAPTEEYVNTYNSPSDEDSIKSSTVSVLKASGFVTDDMAAEVFLALRDYISTRDGADHWASISLTSFTDTPWKVKKNLSYTFHPTDCTITAFIKSTGNYLHEIITQRK